MGGGMTIHYLFCMKKVPLEFKITEEMLQALFQGQKVVFDCAGMPRITLYPPRYGVFMTHEKYTAIKEAVYAQAFDRVLELLSPPPKEV